MKPHRQLLTRFWQHPQKHGEWKGILGDQDSRKGAGVVSGGGGPNSLPASLSGMGVCSVNKSISVAVATFRDLEILGVRGVVPPPTPHAVACSCFRVHFKVAFERVLGICVQWATSSPSAVAFSILGLRGSLGFATGSTFSFPPSWATSHATNRACNVFQIDNIHLEPTGCPSTISMSPNTRMTDRRQSKREVQMHLWTTYLALPRCPQFWCRMYAPGRR